MRMCFEIFNFSTFMKKDRDRLTRFPFLIHIGEEIELVVSNMGKGYTVIVYRGFFYIHPVFSRFKYGEEAKSCFYRGFLDFEGMIDEVKRRDFFNETHGGSCLLDFKFVPEYLRSFLYRIQSSRIIFFRKKICLEDRTVDYIVKLG